jgi:taurine dioxygenase
MTITSDIDVIPIGAALGAEIRGIDLSEPLDASAYSHIEDAFNRHSVHCFRDQNLN